MTFFTSQCNFGVTFLAKCVWSRGHRFTLSHVVVKVGWKNVVSARQQVLYNDQHLPHLHCNYLTWWAARSRVVMFDPLRQEEHQTRLNLGFWVKIKKGVLLYSRTFLFLFRSRIKHLCREVLEGTIWKNFKQIRSDAEKYMQVSYWCK